jgi:membrane associated rhomboid family serine protease
VTLPPHLEKAFLMANATIPARFPAFLAGQIDFHSAFLPLITSMFMHAGIAHIAGNMLFLWIFGDNVEDSFGHFTYLLFYLVCGVGSSLLHVLVNFSSTLPALGASGAISGVMGAYLMLYPGSRILTLAFIFPVPIPAVVILGYWFFLQFVAGVTSLGTVGSVASGGVAWWAHIGGFLIGMLLARLARSSQRARQAAW